MKKVKLLIACMAALGILAGCTQNQGAATDSSNKIQVVATTTMLADLAEVLGGERVEVVGLMGPGIDPHLYQASAGDVSKMQNADVVLYNGLHLEGKMGEIFENLVHQNKKVISIEEGLDSSKLLSSEDEPGLYDPHIWFDATIWADAARFFVNEMSEVDADGVTYYENNLQNYLKELDEVNAYIRDRVEEIPSESRVLVTAHDAFQYFGKAYGIEVRGLQGISTEAEAGTADVSELADFIVSKKIKAIFVESSVPTKMIESLQAAVAAKGFEVSIGGELFSDSIGDKGTEGGTYLGMMKANIDTIVDALK